jgi:TPR repeat protein
MMKTVLCKLMVFCIALLCSSVVQAGDLADGFNAYELKDYATALSRFRSAAQQGSAGAQAMLGAMYEDGEGIAQDYKEAVRWFQLSAAQGFAAAQYNLGVMYYEGKGVAQDYKEAVRWFQLSAAQGFASAQYNLALMYGKGQGVAQDYIKGHMWLNLAATGGDSKAVKGRDLVTAKLTPEQVAEAQKLARECQARNFKNCD